MAMEDDSIIIWVTTEKTASNGRDEDDHDTFESSDHFDLDLGADNFGL